MMVTTWRTGPLVAALFFIHGAAIAAAPDPVTGTGSSPIPTATPSPSGSASSPSLPATPAQRPAELDYLPRKQGSEDDREVGWVLIAAAVVLAIVIVVFVLRHRRTGRPG